MPNVASVCVCYVETENAVACVSAAPLDFYLAFGFVGFARAGLYIEDGRSRATTDERSTLDAPNGVRWVSFLGRWLDRHGGAP